MRIEFRVNGRTAQGVEDDAQRVAGEFFGQRKFRIIRLDAKPLAYAGVVGWWTADVLAEEIEE